MISTNKMSLQKPTNIISPSDFDISKVSFGAIKTLDNGSKTVPISYDGAPFRVHTPRMHAPYGINTSVWDGNNRVEADSSNQSAKLTIDLSFGDYEGGSSKLQSFYEMIHQLQMRLIETGVDNRCVKFEVQSLKFEV
jgi:hypothetical protein